MTKPLAKDLSYHLSEEAKGRSPSKLKVAFKHFFDPKITSLGGGLPLSDLFPFNKVEVESLNPPFSSGIHNLPQSEEEELKFSIGKPRGGPAGEIPLAQSLQYGDSAGAHQLLDFIKEHTKQIHDIAYQDWSVITSVGNTQSWDATLRTFTNRGDTILAEEFTFPSATETCHGNGINVVAVHVDLEGIVPEALEKQLDNWVGPKPKLLYTISTGQNPTGGTLSNERRREVYRIASKHDLILVEDEPYYFLQMPKYTTDKSQRQFKDLTHQEFVDSLVNSYLSVDVDGRVIRLDSFSKVLAPGTRLGWIVAQERFIERYARLHEVTIQVASGFSQSIVYGLLSKWGHDGYLNWLVELRKTYTVKRDLVMDAIEANVPKEIATWVAPTAGMFFWIKLDARKHPKFVSEYKSDTVALEEDLYEKGIAHGVQLVPGNWFFVNDKTSPAQIEPERSEDEKNAIFFRGTFASVTEDKLHKAVVLFSEMLRQEFELNN